MLHRGRGLGGRRWTCRSVVRDERRDDRPEKHAEGKRRGGDEHSWLHRRTCTKQGDGQHRQSMPNWRSSATYLGVFPRWVACPRRVGQGVDTSDRRNDLVERPRTGRCSTRCSVPCWRARRAGWCCSGEAGVGKTALARAVCAEHQGSHRVLRGSCDALFTPARWGRSWTSPGRPAVSWSAWSPTVPGPTTWRWRCWRSYVAPALLVLEDLHRAERGQPRCAEPAGGASGGRSGPGRRHVSRRRARSRPSLAHRGRRAGDEGRRYPHETGAVVGGGSRAARRVQRCRRRRRRRPASTYRWQPVLRDRSARGVGRGAGHRPRRRPRPGGSLSPGGRRSMRPPSSRSAARTGCCRHSPIPLPISSTNACPRAC